MPRLYSLVKFLLFERATRTEVGPTALCLKFVGGALNTLQSFMTVRVHSIRSIHHFLAQEIQLPDTNPAMMATSTREPMLGPEKPRPEREDADNTQRNRRVVEGLAGDGILRGKTKDDGNEQDPKANDGRDRFGARPKVERPTLEVPRPDEGHCDRDPV